MNEQPQAARSDQVAELRRAVSAGELDVATLIDRLANSDWVLRRAQIAVLASLGDQAAGPLLDALATRRDDEARIAAMVDALSSSTGAIDAAVARLATHTDPAVVADVAAILGRRRSAQAVPTLVRLTSHRDDNVAVCAIEALGRIGSQSAVEALIDCVEGSNFFRVFPAIDVLGRTGDPRAIAPLSRLLDNPRYAFEAARALGRTADRGAVAPLLKLAGSGSESSVRVACLALSDLREQHAARYGTATMVESALRAARSQSLVRKLGQSIVSADKQEKIALCRVLGALQDAAALPWILPLLDGEAEVARVAGDALKDLGRESDIAIDRALLEPHSARRAVLLPSITRADHGEAVLVCLHDSDPSVRVLAAETLARIGYARATFSLFALLGDDNPRVVMAISAAIQALGCDDTEALALAAAVSPRANVRRAALRILAYFGFESALDVFVTALVDPDTRLRDVAVQGLSLLHAPAARRVLLDSSKSADPKLRAAAQRALGQSESDDETLRALQDGLRDADPWVRYYACQSLGRRHAHQSVQAIAELLRDDAGQVRVAAVEALSQLGGALALQTLHGAVAADDLDVRRAALLGLGSMKDPSALDTLLSALRGQDAPTRLVALSALANFDGEDSTRAFSEAARDDDESVRTAAIGFLQASGDLGASEALISLVRDDRDRLRALDALAQPAGEPRIDALLRALDDADDTLAPLLVSCLSKLQRRGAQDALFRAQSSPNRRARLSVAHALAALGTRNATAALARAAQEDPDPEVRRVCALHLAS